MKPCTAALCSMLRSSWRLRRPATSRQPPAAPPSSGAALQRFFASPMEVRSRRAMSVSPRPARTRRPLAAGTRAASPRSRRAEVICAVRARETPSKACRCSGLSHGQSARRSSARFSAVLSSADNRQLGTSNPAAPATGAAGGVGRASGRSSGSTPCGTARSRTALREMAALTEGSLQIAPSGVSVASRSRARTAGYGEAGQQPARVAQPHLVREE